MAEFIQYGGNNGGSYAAQFSCKLSVWENSYSVSSNSSNVGYKLELISGSGGRFSGLTANFTVCIDSQGTPQYRQGSGTYSSQSYNTAQTICEGTFTVYHNADGSKKIGCWAVLDFQSHTYSPGDFGVEGYMDLTRIPRASTPSISGSPVLGEKITINTNRASSSFTHNLTYKISSMSGAIAGSVGSSTTWTIPKDLANVITNSTRGTLQITCDTYNGSSYVGSKTVSVSIYVPDTEEFYPTMSDTSGVIGENSESNVPNDWGIYVQNQSKIDYQVLAQGVYGSTITSYKVVVNGATYNTATGTTEALTMSGTNSLVMTITDSRGRTNTLTDLFEVVEYNGPSITKFNVNRCNEDGILNEEGEFAKIDITATVPTLNDKNTYSYNLQYKDIDNDFYTQHDITLTETKTDTKVTFDGSFIIEANGDNSYDYMFSISDTFISNVNKVDNIGTAFQLFNWNASGRGFAMGKVSEKDAFEINIDTYIEKNLYAKKDIYDKFGQLVEGGKNLIKTFHLENDTTEFTIDGLDIIKDGGTYEVEMYLQHNKANDFAVGIQINGLTDAKWTYQGIDAKNNGTPTTITNYGSTSAFGRIGAIRNNFTGIIKFTINKADFSFGGALRYFVDAVCMNGNFLEHTISQYQPASLDVNLTSIKIMNVTNTEVFRNGSYVKIYKK